jgi:hypothetical protein
MKKNEDAAAKKKPKTSAAQIRVQKGMYYSSIDIAFWRLKMLTTDRVSLGVLIRLDRAGLTIDNEDELS